MKVLKEAKKWMEGIKKMLGKNPRVFLSRDVEKEIRMRTRMKVARELRRRLATKYNIQV